MLNRAGQVIRSTANALTTPAGLLLGLTLLALVAGDSRMQVVENKLSGGNHPTLHLAEGIAYERKTEVDINVNYVMVHRELNTTAWIKGLAALQKIISEHDKFCSSYKNMAQATKKQSSQFVAITVPDYRYNVSNWEGRCEQLSLALPEVREDNEKYELWALMKRHKLTFIPAGLEWDQAEDYPLFMSDKKSARDRGGMDKICSQEANSDWHSLTPYTDNGKKQWIYQDWCTNGDCEITPCAYTPLRIEKLIQANYDNKTDKADTIICMQRPLQESGANRTAAAAEYNRMYEKCYSEQREYQSEYLDLHNAVHLVLRTNMSDEMQIAVAEQQRKLLENPYLLPLSKEDGTPLGYEAMKVVHKRNAFNMTGPTNNNKRENLLDRMKREETGGEPDLLDAPLVQVLRDGNLDPKRHLKIVNRLTMKEASLTNASFAQRSGGKVNTTLVLLVPSASRVKQLGIDMHQQDILEQELLDAKAQQQLLRNPRQMSQAFQQAQTKSQRDEIRAMLKEGKKDLQKIRAYVDYVQTLYYERSRIIEQEIEDLLSEIELIELEEEQQPADVVADLSLKFSLSDGAQDGAAQVVRELLENQPRADMSEEEKLDAAIKRQELFNQYGRYARTSLQNREGMQGSRKPKFLESAVTIAHGLNKKSHDEQREYLIEQTAYIPQRHLSTIPDEDTKVIEGDRQARQFMILPEMLYKVLLWQQKQLNQTAQPVSRPKRFVGALWWATEILIQSLQRER